MGGRLGLERLVWTLWAKMRCEDRGRHGYGHVGPHFIGLNLGGFSSALQRVVLPDHRPLQRRTDSPSSGAPLISRFFNEPSPRPGKIQRKTVRKARRTGSVRSPFRCRDRGGSGGDQSRPENPVRGKCQTSTCVPGHSRKKSRPRKLSHLPAEPGAAIRPSLFNATGHDDASYRRTRKSTSSSRWARHRSTSWLMDSTLGLVRGSGRART